MQGARRGIRSRVSRITPWAEGSAKPLSHPGCPRVFLLKTEVISCHPFLKVLQWVVPFFQRKAHKSLCNTALKASHFSLLLAPSLTLSHTGLLFGPSHAIYMFPPQGPTTNYSLGLKQSSSGYSPGLTTYLLQVAVQMSLYQRGLF